MQLTARLILPALLSCLPLWAQSLPAGVEAALARARIPQGAVAVLVQDAEASKPPRLAHRSNVAMNPASVMKLVTTYAALDLLGPAYTWSTPIYLDGRLRNGVLEGNVYIKGQGDPKLVLERLWLLLRRLQGLGVRRIAGDLVLDRSAFELPASDPARFDGEPLRPYNAAPDALLVNYKSLVLTFSPQPGANVAQLQVDPPLLGLASPTTVPLSEAPCNDYRAALKADFADPNRLRFNGSFPAACGEKVWPVAYADPASFATRAVAGVWQTMGGQVDGQVRYGSVPAALLANPPAAQLSSPTLAEVVRDINKFSNNVMAQQLFLTLGLLAGPNTNNSASTDWERARAVLQGWWAERMGGAEAPVLDNGSGLSRGERISAQALGQLLTQAYHSPLMSELMSSLPITGTDGTLRRFKGASAGSAHLKTGSLSNVMARAGFVDSIRQRRYVLVALINHPNANSEAAREAMELLVDWVAQDAR
jgi:serine-type D-Ala-D-Ala carboxypeptidase/endopeptidase (penicillin-binding protein 4)